MAESFEFGFADAVSMALEPIERLAGLLGESREAGKQDTFSVLNALTQRAKGVLYEYGRQHGLDEPELLPEGDLIKLDFGD